MAIIIMGSVSLIYNAFAISVSERSRHLGMLSSVGATNRQKKKSVFFEGAVIGLISIPIGIICGLAGMGITFYFINSIIQDALGIAEKLTAIVTPFSILIACAVSVLTIFISTYIPAKRASKISAIDAIRQTADVKLTRKVVKTSKMVRKLFGIEAEIGLKNLKRNRRRYQATVFSLVISIVLFLSVVFVTDNLKKALGLSQDGVNYDIQVLLQGEDTRKDEQLIKSIGSLEGVTEYNVVKEMGLSSFISEASIADELRNRAKVDKDMLKNGKLPYDIIIHSLNEENLKAYAKEVGANFEQLTNPKKVSAIVIDTVPYQDMETGKFVETKAIHTKVGHSLDLHYEDGETEEETYVDKVEIAALTDQLPMGVRLDGELAMLDIIVSEQVMEQLISKKDNARVRSKLLLKSTNPLKTQQEIEELKEVGIYVHNVYQTRKRDEQMIVLMSVFIYGFILLITAISIANIFNTISTSISLRKREFAMLKSVGMTPTGFNKMINYESIFYGIKSLLYGLPISIIVMYLIHRSMMNSFDYAFVLPWLIIGYVIAAVFVIVGAAMLYSSSKVKKETIIDALKQESI
ncbi:ABC-type antimicrobial peptide transport system permease subunit [Filibacter limicola]|uniref:ABC-type antimicrobial peptide transport system permease subunit n=1 Tax=Sporosarcina limicola TaxID=34101 RepID=A0A927R7N5_9BACL|nr:ABC-type antimicrobial peptide transport system permease subunit [Sporosarcina limicola]